MKTIPFSQRAESLLKPYLPDSYNSGRSASKINTAFMLSNTDFGVTLDITVQLHSGAFQRVSYTKLHVSYQNQNGLKARVLYTNGIDGLDMQIKFGEVDGYSYIVIIVNEPWAVLRVNKTQFNGVIPDLNPIQGLNSNDFNVIELH